MIRLAHPMEQAMAWPRHHGPEDLARALGGLPDEILVRPLGGAHLVIGPAGAQVVALDDGSHDAPRSAARLASVVRSALAEEVPWMPFVHALLVTDRPDPCPPATRISPALLLRAVAEGPVTLDARILDRLRHAIAGGALDGLASVAPVAPAAAPAARGVPTSR
jgi:hypothetical protein